MARRDQNRLSEVEIECPRCGTVVHQTRASPAEGVCAKCGIRFLKLTEDWQDVWTEEGRYLALEMRK